MEKKICGQLNVLLFWLAFCRYIFARIFGAPFILKQTSSHIFQRDKDIIIAISKYDELELIRMKCLFVRRDCEFFWYLLQAGVRNNFHAFGISQIQISVFDKFSDSKTKRRTSKLYKFYSSRLTFTRKILRHDFEETSYTDVGT